MIEKAQHTRNMYKPHLQLDEGRAVSAIFKLNKVFILDFHTVMSGTRIQKATSPQSDYFFAIHRSTLLLILSFTNQATNQPNSQSVSQSVKQPVSQGMWNIEWKGEGRPGALACCLAPSNVRCWAIKSFSRKTHFEFKALNLVKRVLT